MFHDNTSTELRSYSRVTPETASLVAKYKLLHGFGWGIAKERHEGVERENHSFLCKYVQEELWQSTIALPLSFKTSPALTFQMKARLSFDKLQFGV